jgi:hypothetical protein
VGQVANLRRIGSNPPVEAQLTALGEADYQYQSAAG